MIVEAALSVCHLNCSIHSQQVVLNWLPNPDLHFIKRRVDKILGIAPSN